MHTAARAVSPTARASPLPEQTPKRQIPGGLGDSVPQPCYPAGDEKHHRQLVHRCALPLIRHLLAQFRANHLKAAQAAQRLGLSRARLYKLYADYLRACATHQESTWTPGVSGGDHASPWPAQVLALLRKRLSSRPPASYSFAASEVLRLCDFKLDRAQVRRWAIQNQLARPSTTPRPPAAIRRWQRSQIGELWQLDASPHRWFPDSRQAWPMLNMLDDCSRVFVGSKLYRQETLLAYLDFLPAAFLAYGLPLELYVDYHSFFFTRTPEALTQLGWALHFYGVSLRYAPTPQAKGKVEREHLFWQLRLPAYFASEAITDLDQANPHIQALRCHRNEHEVHRELRMTPNHAWEQARRQKRSVLRPAPRCPWWPYVWSQRVGIRVGPDGRVPIGTQRLRLDAAVGSRLILCHHPTGHHSVLTNQPNHQSMPVVLFSDLPKSTVSFC